MPEQGRHRVAQFVGSNRDEIVAGLDGSTKGRVLLAEALYAVISGALGELFLAILQSCLRYRVAQWKERGGPRLCHRRPLVARRPAKIPDRFDNQFRVLSGQKYHKPLI